MISLTVPLSEVMGPGVAQEFAGEGALTIWEDHFLPEVVDPVTGDLVPDGEPGELVLTSLTKQALPIIRYRTRDLTRLLPGLQTPMRQMTKITGRSDDMMIVRGVNVFPIQIEELVLRCPALSPHFLVELSRVGRMDEMTVLVARRAGGDEGEAERDARTLTTLAKEVIGISVHVEVQPAGTIARSAGKAARVRNLRDKVLAS